MLTERARTGDQPELDTIYLLRARVLQVSLTILAVAMPLASITLIANAAYSGTLTTISAVMAGAMLVFPALRLGNNWIGFQTSAIVLVTCLALSALLLASRGGLTVGYGLICLLIIQLAALFFGRRGAVVGVGGVVALHLLAWFLFQSHFGAPVALDTWDPRNNALWVRHLVLLGSLGLLFALGELFVVEQLTRALAMHRDVAEREKAQRLALEEADRVQAQQREQRALAQQAIERSHRIESLARVAGGVAHDFNNALTVILGTAEAAKMDSRSPEDVETYMDEIVEAVQHASVLTGQLLTLGRQQLSKRAPLSITALLGRLRPAIARVLPADIVLVIDMPTDDATISIDETGLHRAILNLVLNARDAMPRGGTVTISCRRDTVKGRRPQLADGAYVTLTVSDDGAGMDQDTLERIFDPFFTTKGDKGTGLGLASVHAFVKEMDGAIDVASTPGQGTAFEIRLPEIEGRPNVISDQATASAPSQAAQPPGTILVAEDREDVRSTMKRALAHHGFTVLEARSGDEALTILESRVAVALMCIDGVMPGLSTAITIERARALAPQMQVIVCSGHVQEELLRRGIETGRYEFLAKPFTPQELVARVLRVLEHQARKASRASGERS